MNNILYTIVAFSFLLSVDSPSDKFLSSIDVDNRLGETISGNIQVLDQDNNNIELNDYFSDKPTVLVMAYYV